MTTRTYTSTKRMVRRSRRVARATAKLVAQPLFAGNVNLLATSA
ncbi:hypothetical protein [Kordiimonas sp. SCSIO 12603]|nr:hypothetical protein [Kordiimonas sp. SCSIO 12603]